MLGPVLAVVRIDPHAADRVLHLLRRRLRIGMGTAAGMTACAVLVAGVVEMCIVAGKGCGESWSGAFIERSPRYRFGADVVLPVTGRSSAPFCRRPFRRASPDKNPLASHMKSASPGAPGRRGLRLEPNGSHCVRFIRGALARLRSLALPLVSIVLIAAAVVVIHLMTRDVHVHEVRDALSSILAIADGARGALHRRQLRRARHVRRARRHGRRARRGDDSESPRRPARSVMRCRTCSASACSPAARCATASTRPRASTRRACCASSARRTSRWFSAS